MKQSQLPKFKQVGFEPGYSYTIGTEVFSAAGRYWGLGENGRLYQFVMLSNGKPTWEMIGEDSV